MNYYEHHIGDYAEATLHLNFVEDAAYARLIRKYYATEKPLPAELKTVQRLVGARSREERQAVELVLQEFFVLTEDGWHNKRCDEVIAAYHAGEPERVMKKANEENRLRRHRDERQRLFRQITEAGLHAPWNIGIGELRELASQVSLPANVGVGASASVNLSADAVAKTAMAAATASTTLQDSATPSAQWLAATPATANQTPDTQTQSQTQSQSPVPNLTVQAAAVCVALRALGMASCNPQHPDLLALLAAGAQETDFVQALRIARERGKGFAYVLGVVKGQRADASRLRLSAAQGQTKSASTPAARHAKHDVEEPV